MTNLQLFLCFAIFVILYVAYNVIIYLNYIKLKYVFVPFPKSLIKKYLNQDWDIDKYNHILRLIPKNKDIKTQMNLLGVVRINSWNRLFNIKVKNCTVTPSVIDLYSYKREENTIGKLIFSISSPENVTIGTGEFKVSDGLYIPMLRVGGELSKPWLESIKVNGPMLKSLRHEQKYQKAMTNTENINPNIVQRQGCASDYKKYQFYENRVVPFSNFIKKSGITLSVKTGDNVKLFYNGKVKGSYGGIIISNIIGNLLQDVHGVDKGEICTEEWTITSDRDIHMSETMYAHNGIYQTPMIAVRSLDDTGR